MGNSGIMRMESIFENMEWEHSGYKMDLSNLIREGPLGAGLIYKIGAQKRASQRGFPAPFVYCFRVLL